MTTENRVPFAPGERPDEYPNSLDERKSLEMLVAMVDKLRYEMSHPNASPVKWDDRKPTFFYLDRNLKWAKEVLAREGVPSEMRDTMPEPGHCACKFSSGGVLSKGCEWHKRLLDAAVLAEREACALVCDDLVARDWYGHREEYAARIRARTTKEPT